MPSGIFDTTLFPVEVWNWGEVDSRASPCMIPVLAGTTSGCAEHGYSIWYYLVLPVAVQSTECACQFTC